MRIRPILQVAHLDTSEFSQDRLVVSSAVRYYSTIRTEVQPHGMGSADILLSLITSRFSAEIFVGAPSP